MEREEGPQEAHGSVGAVGAGGDVRTGEVEEEFATRHLGRGFGRGTDAEELAASFEVFGLGPTGEEPEVTYADIAGGEDMKQEAADELGGGQGARFLRSALSIPVCKGDTTISEIGDAMVGDSDAVGVAPEVVQNLFGSCEGGFGVDDPGLGSNLAKKPAKPIGGLEGGCLPGKLEVARMKGLFDETDEHLSKGDG